MTTFGKATFNAVSYAASRPTYPRVLFDHVFRFHGADASGAQWDTAVDLGPVGRVCDFRGLVSLPHSLHILTGY